MKRVELNTRQQEAVDHIYGPLLVLAGPGTGKTQLLSERIAHILEQTDANPSNILCLTFTENAALNMRERLKTIIGEDAYDVHIATYHGFGSDIIRSYPEYFETVDLETGKDTRLEKPIDDLQQIQLIEEIVSKLPFSSALYGAHRYPKQVVSIISDLKRALFTPETLRELAESNIKDVQNLSGQIATLLENVKRMPSKADASIDLFGPVLEVLAKKTDGSSLVALAAEELEEALGQAAGENSSKPLTAWKNAWLNKDDSDRYCFTNLDQHLRINELAKVYSAYQKQLEDSGLYDYDDMILRSIEGLATNDELKFNLQEKYHFILLDEFQDTNASQFELVLKLGDNPVNEGQPNIFAVGDDDQAIYAFQGAHVGNMLRFTREFRDVRVINLTDNYRSHPEIIDIAHNISSQIDSRLHTELDGVTKTLEAASQNLPKDAQIERHEFESQANEYGWVAAKVSELIKQGVSPAEIAVLAPGHKYLQSLVPFLHAQDVPVAYEKRENVLDTKLMRSFELMVELVLACTDQDVFKMNELFPRVLSLDFYNVPVQKIWQLNWQSRREQSTNWAELALEDEELAPHVIAYLGLGTQSTDMPLEYLLDHLSGSTPLSIDGNEYTSPLKDYYFSSSKQTQLSYYEAIANLSVIRDHIRSHQASTDSILTAEDFLNLFAAYRNAEQPLVNTHPIAQAKDSVTLTTAYKAKGLEYEHVFLLQLHEDVWGTKARGAFNRISLPANLAHVRYRGSGDDELRRLLFVAITRAKHGLWLTSHQTKDNGKQTETVKYMRESREEGVSHVLPESKQTLHQTKTNAESQLENIELLWEQRHIEHSVDTRSLLAERLARYQMSPTHLNTITDEEYGGWEVFLLGTLLRFPQAPGEDGEFGNAVHMSLEKYQRSKGSKEELVADFEKLLSRRYISSDRMPGYKLRGAQALEAYINARVDMFARQADVEVDFRKEGVVLGEAHLTGKIDRLEIDKEAKELRIVDFKTGRPETRWASTPKLKKYKQQLYFYKLLIEGSHTWTGYTVTEARLEFVEPNSSGEITEPLVLNYKETEEAELKELIKVLWRQIQSLNT